MNERKPPPPLDPTTRTKIGRPAAATRLADHDLVVVAGPDEGARWPLAAGPVRVGKDRAGEVALTDPAVSRHHLTLVQTPDGCLLTDPGSTNGTLVNGLRVKEAILTPGTIIEIGDTTLRFQRRLAELSGDFASLVGKSAPMRALFRQLEQVAPTALSVVLIGETGTGKELVARAIHQRSPRAKGPCVVLDCAATEPALMAAAMFGHTAGAFTGATDRRTGAFVSASGGTLFVDEIGELPLELQPKLLRVLETHEVQPVGADSPVKVDVRILAATHRNLDEMVAAGRFRQDLYYRLAGLVVEVPPLRERPEDILPLARHFLAATRPELELSSGAQARLAAHPWPGNVRELKNVLERSAALAGPIGTLEESHLVFGRSSRVVPATPSLSASGQLAARSLEDVEREAVAAALASSGWNKVEASRTLGITRKTLDAKIEKYGLKKV